MCGRYLSDGFLQPRDIYQPFQAAYPALAGGYADLYVYTSQHLACDLDAYRYTGTNQHIYTKADEYINGSAHKCTYGTANRCIYTTVNRYIYTTAYERNCPYLDAFQPAYSYTHIHRQRISERAVRGEPGYTNKHLQPGILSRTRL